MATIIETDWGLINLDTFCYALWRRHDGKFIVDVRFIGENGFIRTFPTLEEAKEYIKEIKRKIEEKQKN